MQDRDLKNLLMETHPVRPGQEEAAWARLKGQFAAKDNAGAWERFLFPPWRKVGFGTLAILAAVALLDVTALQHHRVLLSAASQAPGIYATSFYSSSAQAQVVWLNGMEPASDNLTYLDPTSVIHRKPAASSRVLGDPDSL